jgi:hypothetical protein
MAKQFYRWPCITYVKFSTDNFTKKHLLGVMDTEEIINESGNTASYAACDEMERRGWVKLTHNHDLRKNDIIMQIRHLALTKNDGNTVDDSFYSLQPAREIVEKLVRLIDQEVWNS